MHPLYLTLLCCRRATTGVLLISAICTLSSCKRENVSGGGDAGDAPLQRVRCVKAHQDDVVDYVEFVGRTHPFERVEARARVSGFLRKIHFEPSQMVKKGDLLFSIEEDQYRAIYEEALAQIHVCDAQIKLAEANVARSSQLVKQSAISVQQYDTDVAALAEARATKVQAEATAALRKLSVEYTQIVSPIDGRVDHSLVDEGNYVTGGVVGGTVLTTVLRMKPIYAYGSIDEGVQLEYTRRHPELSKGQQMQRITDLKIPVHLQLQDEQGFPHKGMLDYIQNEIDQSTGTSQARGIFQNEDGLLKPGMFVRMRIPLSDEYKAVVVPDRAVGTDQATRFVFVVGDDGVVEQRQVKLGDRKEDGNRVIRSGLKIGEQVVVAGVSLIRSGMKVQVTDDPADSTAPSGTKEPTAHATPPHGSLTSDATSPSGR